MVKVGMTAAKKGKKRHEQVSMEYLFTYSFVIILIALALVGIYFFILAPASLPPNQCYFASGIKCNEIVISTNSVETYATIIASLSNSQQYSIKDPLLIVNASRVGVQSGICFPDYVKPGGVVVCTISVKNKIPNGMLVQGKLYINATVCTYVSGTSNCEGQQKQTFAGSFSTRTSQSVSALFPTCLLDLSPSKALFYNNGTEEVFVANVKVLGSPIAGAVVNFTTNNTKVKPGLLLVSTDSNGNAATNLRSTRPASVNLTASFGGKCTNYSTVEFNSTAVELESGRVQTPAYIYVANYGGGSQDPIGNVVIINTATGSVAGAITQGFYRPEGIAFSPNGAYAYVPNGDVSNVVIINTATNTVTGVLEEGSNATLIAGPTGVAISPDGTYAYITNAGAIANSSGFAIPASLYGSIAVVDTATNTVVNAIIQGFNWPGGVAFAPSGSYAYATNYNTNNVVIINTATNTVVKAITQGFAYPQGVAFSPNGAYAYVTNLGSGNNSNVAIINTATNTVTGTITGFYFPWGVAFSKNGTYAYVANGNNVLIINTATNTIVGAINQGTYIGTGIGVP